MGGGGCSTCLDFNSSEIRKTKTIEDKYPLCYICFKGRTFYVETLLVLETGVHGLRNTPADNITSTEYTECLTFFPVVRIGSPHPLTRKGVLLLPPLEPNQGELHTRLRGRGWENPVPTKG